VFPPYATSIVGPDENGKKWLRVPVNSPLGQTVVLTSNQLPMPVGATPGHHYFEVRVVDLQGEVDPSPARFDFYLENYIEPTARSGILMIDDDIHQQTQSPDAVVDAKYANMLADYTGNVTVYERPADPANRKVANTHEDIRKRAIAFSELQKYKLVIYHNDNPADPGNLVDDVDGYALYMLRGGNLLMSHTHLLSSVLDNLSKSGARITFLRYIGLLDAIPNLPYPHKPDSPNWYFFQKAVAAMTGYSDVNLQFGDPAAFNPIINTRKGLATLTYFPTTSFSGDTLYKFGCKPVSYATFPPTQAQFDALNNQVVAYRRVNTNNSRAYIFGFPLSYMVESESRTMMNKILSEVM